jgi:hypothetical protein
MDLAFAEKLGKTFEQAFPGIAVRVERSGAERIFTRIGQEYSSNIRAVDVVNTSDLSHCVVWKRDGWLAPYMPEEVAKHYDPQFYDTDGLYVTTRILVSPIAYNTKLVKNEDAPKSFADLLDPKWKGKICKAHPAYSGTIMNSTFQIVRDLGWDYLERPASRSRSSIRRRARRWRRARARCSRPPPIPTPHACSRTGCMAGTASSCWSTGRANIRLTSRPWRSRACARSVRSS